MNLDKWTKRLETRALANDGQLAYLKSQKREKIISSQLPLDHLRTFVDHKLMTFILRFAVTQEKGFGFISPEASISGVCDPCATEKQRKSSSCHRTIGYVQADSCAIAR